MGVFSAILLLLKPCRAIETWRSRGVERGVSQQRQTQVLRGEGNDGRAMQIARGGIRCR